MPRRSGIVMVDNSFDFCTVYSWSCCLKAYHTGQHCHNTIINVTTIVITIVITFVTVIVRDIVVGLFHLAGIEEDEDLLYSCTEDVRSENGLSRTI